MYQLKSLLEFDNGAIFAEEIGGASEQNLVVDAIAETVVRRFAIGEDFKDRGRDFGGDFGTDFGGNAEDAVTRCNGQLESIRKVLGVKR